MRRIQDSFSGMRALAVPFLLPNQKIQEHFVSEPATGSFEVSTVLWFFRVRKSSFHRDPRLQHTGAHVSSLATCQRVLAAARPGVDCNGFPNDEAILHQFPDLLACNMNKSELQKLDLKHYNLENVGQIQDQGLSKHLF